MTDFYAMLFGRPSPGRRLRDHLRDDPTSEEARRVRSAGAVAVVPVAPNPPEWSREATQARARRRRTEGSTPAVQVPAPEVPPGAPDQPQEHVPFSVASGQDDTPFGSDFAAWYEATRGRPLPSQFMEQDPIVVAQGEPAANGGPLGIEGGVVNMPTRMEHGANDHAPTVQVHLPPIRGRQWDPERQAGIRPDFDPDVEWAKAEYAAQQRWRRGEPTQADLTFAAIMGRPPGRPMTNTRRRADGAVQQGQASYGDIPEMDR